jgi:hypothetical protein
VAPLLTLITYLVAAALAIGYVCETGLPFWRRAAACVLGLVLAVGAGQLLTSSDPVVGYAMGISALLILGVIMIAPERKGRPAAPPGRRVSDRPRSATTTVPWQFDRRAPRRRGSLAIGTDPRAALHTSPVVEIARVAPAPGITRAPAAARTSSGPATSARGVADRRAGQRRQSRRGAPRSLSRMSRCRYR